MRCRTRTSLASGWGSSTQCHLTTLLTSQGMVGAASGWQHAPAQKCGTSPGNALGRYRLASHLSATNMAAHSATPSSQSSQVSDTP